MTESVFIVHYTHKHGDDISAFSTRKKAEAAVESIMIDRVHESWEQIDRERFEQASTFDHRLEYFHAVEQNVSYGERISLFECDLQ